MNKTRLTRNQTETKKWPNLKTRNQTGTRMCPYFKNQEPEPNQELTSKFRHYSWFGQELLVKQRSSWLKAGTSWFENIIFVCNTQIKLRLFFNNCLQSNECA